MKGFVWNIGYEIYFFLGVVFFIPMLVTHFESSTLVLNIYIK